MPSGFRPDWLRSERIGKRGTPPSGRTVQRRPPEIQWDEKAGAPSAILGYHTNAYGGPSAQSALAFLRANAGMFGITDVVRDLRLSKSDAEGGLTQITFQQVYKGIPVLYSGYMIVFDRGGAIHHVGGSYFPEINVDTRPSLAPAGVVNLIRSDIGQAVTMLQAPELVVYVDRNSEEPAYHLAFHAQAVSNDRTRGYEYVIDAQSGKSLYRVDLVNHIDGTGQVYRVHPDFQPLTTVTLPWLLDVSPRRLDGNNIDSNNQLYGDATSSTGQFFYDMSNPHFDDVMVYYHGDEFESFMVGLGMEQNRVGKVTSYTRYPNVYAGSISALGELYFGGENLAQARRNPTYEAAVIQHEYMHVVSETYNPLTQTDEARGMDEAYSDYFALAAKNRFVASSVIGEYVDMDGGCVDRRNLVNSYTYGQFAIIDTDGCNGTEQHDRSVIFSGALWDFRRSAGVDPTTADKLIRASLGNLGTYPTFLDGRNALISAANALGYAGYVTAIKTAFSNHGIIPPAPVASSITGPFCALEQTANTWTANISGGDTPFQIDWYKRSSSIYASSSTGTTGDGVEGGTIIPNRPPPSGDFAWVGRGAQLTYTPIFGESDFELKFIVQDAMGRSSESSTTFITVGGCNDPILSVNGTGQGAQLAGKALLSDQALPQEYGLEANYPNPFSRSTEIRFSLPEAGHVRLVVYDVAGREVARLVDDRFEAGYHRRTFDASGLPSGVYIYRLTAGNFTKTRQMVLVK